MFTVKDIREEYDRLDKFTNVDTSNIMIEISTTSLKRLGCCHFFNNQPSRITIADFVLKDKKLFYDVIRHEYAHAVVKLRYPNEKHGHDYVWKRVCIEVGCKPSCKYSVESDTLNNIINEKAKYVVTCETCGKLFPYQRKPKIIEAIKNNDTGRYSCPKCRNSKFSYRQAS